MKGRKVIIIGAGIGGLFASIRLAQMGFKVQIIEARNQAGGFASGFVADNFNFDSSFYILFDKKSLEWALQQINIDIYDILQLQTIHEIYHVLHKDGTELAFDKDLEITAGAIEAKFKGSGILYKNFINHTHKIYQSVQPLSYKTQPSFMDVLLSNSLKHVPFMINNLGSILEKSHLPKVVQQSLSIWTYLAGQTVNNAPSTMSLMPGILHHSGAYYSMGGIKILPETLINIAEKSGVEITYGQKVKTIVTKNKTVTGVSTQDIEFFPADAVISNYSGIGTYMQLLEEFSETEKQKLNKHPLQSTGICIYLSVKGINPPYYIRFKLSDAACVAFVQPGIPEPQLERNGWYPAKLFTHLDHDAALKLGHDGQLELMDELVQDKWWQTNISGYKILHKRSTYEWGTEFNLYRDSMNPVMSSKFITEEHTPYKSKYIKHLYHTGSSTSLGQGINLCAISGIHAANCLTGDLK